MPFGVSSQEELTNERLAGYIAPGIGEEIDGSIGNITNMANTAERLRLDVGSLCVGWKQTLQALRFFFVSQGSNATLGRGTYLSLRNRARRNNVGGHSTWAVLDGHGVGQRVNAGLGNGHMGLEGHATVVQGGADEDDSATSSCGGRLY